MSVFNIKSNVITQRDNTGLKTLLGPPDAVGRVMEVFGCNQTSAAVIDVGSQIRLCPVPSSARITDLDYIAQTLQTSALDIAVWYPTNIPQGGFTAPAASLEGTLISSSAFIGNIAGATVGWTTGLGVAVTPTIQLRSQPLWQVLGLSTDPEIDFDIGFTVRTATTAQGYVGMRVRFVGNN